MQQNPATEQNLSIRKDCEVEISSEDDGFVDAWYRAILEDNPTKSGRKKLQVRYTTLLEEDFSTPLTEKVQQRFIRPVPPEDINEEVDFEEGSVVDADLKDGWWTGVVISKIEDENKFLVYFDSPPDIMQFERKQLRPHFHWTGWRWVRPENKELSKSLFSSGTMVEVSCKNDKLETLWVPALIVKEIQDNGDKKFIVKFCNKSWSSNGDDLKSNTTLVDTFDVRPISPPFSVEEYKLLDRVEAFHGLGWCQCLVRRILSGKRYRVSVLATKEEFEFSHSDLRPSMEWEDGVWLQGPKIFKEHNNKDNTRKRKRKQKHDSSLIGDSCNASDAPIIDTSDKICEDDYDQTLSDWILGVKSSTSSAKPKLSIDRSPKAAKNSASDHVANEDTAIVLPFAKLSPVWKVFESMDVFKTVKQIPHFIPLLEIREEFREGSAIGELVNFTTLLERVKLLQLDVPRSTLERLKECFSEFDKYGFDVTVPISRIEMLLSLKDKQVNQVEELKCKEKEIAEEVIRNQRFEEELREVKRKIIELRSQETDLKKKKDASDKKIVQMQLFVANIDKEIEDVELEFQSVVSAPL